MISTQTKSIPARPRSGFSMIDVLVAIVVLATALLALASLQGALTRNSVDARARSQVAAYAEGILDQLRSNSWDNIATATITPSNASGATVREKEAYNVQNAMGIGNLTTNVTSTTWYGTNAGTGVTFSQTPPTPSNNDTPRFKQVNVTTTWNDASGTARTLSMDTMISPLATASDNSLDSKQLSILGTGTPIVREYNPGATAGVIPIAVGTGQQSAATNPKPEILALNGNKTAVVGTSFNVLTYQNPDANNDTIIQQRVDTLVIACSCKWGGAVTADGNSDFTSVITKPYRATYWDGTQYVVPTATGAAKSDTGVDSSATQSDFCDVCCRDRNDSSSDPSTVVKFDPWNTSGDYDHYRYDSTNTLVKVLKGDSNAYLNACRLIRVNGVYSVATDLNNYFFGLLATSTPSSASTTAKSPNPDTTDTTDFGTGGAVGAYQKFVLSYMQTNITNFENLVVPSVSSTATTYGGTPYNLDRPTSISIDYNKTTTDYRYLHARGIYIDYLEPAAVTAIKNAITNCTSSPVSNCFLPILPFTTINLSEIANWSVTTTSANCTSPSNAISVNNQAIINEDFNASRGVVTAQSCSKNGETATVKASIGNSNSGLAATGTGFANPVDKDDANAVNAQNDTQTFGIGTGGASGGGTVSGTVTLTDSSVLPQLVKGYLSIYPSISWQLDSVTAPTGTLTACTANASGNGGNTQLNNYSCPSITTASTPPLTGTMTVKVQTYNYSTTAKVKNPCSGSGNVNVTTCTNLQVDTSKVLVNGVNVTPTVAVTNNGNVGNSSSGTIAEMSTLTFPNLTLNTTDTVSIGFKAEGTTNAYTCSGTTFNASSCP